MKSSSPERSRLELPSFQLERCFVLKKEGFDTQADKYFQYLTGFLGISGLKKIQSGVRYDVEGAGYKAFHYAKYQVFAEAPVDHLLEEADFITATSGKHLLLIESLPGQYDQRADSAAQCLQLISGAERPKVKVANFLIIEGELSDEDLVKIKKALINPVDSREAATEKPATLDEILANPQKIQKIEGFTEFNAAELNKLLLPTGKGGLGLAMTHDDLINVQQYFQKKHRQPTITELKVIDMYWSDHCRHTTFTTSIENVTLDGYWMFKEGYASDIYTHYCFNLVPPEYAKNIAKSIYDFFTEQKRLKSNKSFSLMDIATHHAKILAKNPNSAIRLELSEENNAASIIVPVKFSDGHSEEWLYMFKNETHNHPTEIEPVGGAATCLGGAIRDPLSGRSYVFMGVRVSGAADPRESFSDTLPGKLPQRYISQKAAEGFSGYGNQIGVPALKVQEFYHPGFKAKRMEVGFVGAGVRRENVVRENPKPGDVVILVGGRTGRDGIGGATGSSKMHNETSTTSAGAEVQKGNPPEERKIQRLFRNPAASKLIKKCNDFGAGGVANAIGELAPGLWINLDEIPLKYSGLDGTEMTLSESQERMAVVVSREDAEAFIALSKAENLEATIVAEVNLSFQLNISWQRENICSLDRGFLESGWAKRTASIKANLPVKPFHRVMKFTEDADQKTLQQLWTENLSRLNAASQKGLQMRFDSTVGANTVVGPFGGLEQDTPTDAVIAKFPAEGAETCVAVSVGYNPDLAEHSPYEGGYYAVIESVSKLIASGVDPKKITLTLQNYFEKIGNDPERWGKVFMAQLGVWAAEKELGLAAIGGKDSMSGSFVNSTNGQRIDVPPSIVSFATATLEIQDSIPNFFQEKGNLIVLYTPYGQDDLPNDLGNNHQTTPRNIHRLMQAGKIKSCKAIGNGGLAGALSEMSFGKKMGAYLETDFDQDQWFIPKYGELIFEINPADLAVLQGAISSENLQTLGKVQSDFEIIINQQGQSLNLDLAEIQQKWQSTFEKVFPTDTPLSAEQPELNSAQLELPYPRPLRYSRMSSKPRVLLPVFPGTNCEYETAAAFRREGAETWEAVFRNITPEQMQESIFELAQKIRQSQILVLSGGFSAGDEPDGSGKFIANVLRNSKIRDAIEEFREKDGLILGICNGFQALVKSCLLPNGQIDFQRDTDLTLAHNHIGHYVSLISNHQVTSTISPWLYYLNKGENLAIPVAHGEGRIVAPKEELQWLWTNQQVPFRYVDSQNSPARNFPHNPNGSQEAIAGLTTPSGKILGLMAHPERAITGLQKNIPGDRKGHLIFRAGVDYFTGQSR